MASDSDMPMQVATVAGSAVVSLYIAMVTSVQFSMKWIPKYYKNMSEQDKWTWRSTFASIVNAVIASVWSAYILWNEDLRTEVFWHDSLSTRLLASYEIGYFIADSICLCCFDMQMRKVQYLVHHLFGVVGLGMTVVYKTFAFHTCMRIVSDISTPFMHIRWALHNWHLKDSQIYYINGLIFVVTYTAGRILTMPLYYSAIIEGIRSPSYGRLPLICKTIFFGTTAMLDVLNLYWFILIMKGCLKLIRTKESKE